MRLLGSLLTMAFVSSVAVASVQEFRFDTDLSSVDGTVVLDSHFYVEGVHYKDSLADPVIEAGIIRLEDLHYLATPASISSALDFNDSIQFDLRFRYDETTTLNPDVAFQREILTTSSSDQRDEGFNLAVKRQNGQWLLQFQIADGAGLQGLPNGQGYLETLGPMDPYRWQRVTIIFNLGDSNPSIDLVVNEAEFRVMLDDPNRADTTQIIDLLSGGEYRLKQNGTDRVQFFIGDSPMFKERHVHESTLLVDVFKVGPTSDIDGDGIVDYLDDDDDNDGVSDKQELLDGTDSASAFSCLLVCFDLDVDGNGKEDALTDGLLIIRWMFGFTGDALTSGAIATNAYYRLAADIEARIFGLGARLDIDQNGSVEALTDGLLIIRSLFGFSGEALLSNALATNSPISTSNQIEASMSQLSNRAPVILKTNFKVYENQTTIGRVNASDQDSSELTFAVTGPDIVIDSEGVLSFILAPDYEIKASYTVTVTVSDEHSAVAQEVLVSVADVTETDPVFEYYGTKTPSWVAVPADDYQLFDATTEMGGQMEGFYHEPTDDPGGGKFQFHRIHRTFKHGLEWGQQFGVFGSWLASPDSNNTVEGGHWVNPKVDGPEYYPTLHFGGALISYAACMDVGMGGGIYERVLGDRWLNMVQISNRVLYGAGVNVAFDKEQEPYEDDNGIWAGSGWSYLNFDHPRDFKFWMSFVETGNYQGPVVGYIPEYWNWLDPDLYEPNDIDDNFASLADNGVRANNVMANERIGLKALNLGDGVFYAPVPKLPDYKDKEYLVAHPQGIALSSMETYSTALKEGRLTETLIPSTHKDFTGFYESTHQELKIIEEVNGDRHTYIIEPPYKLEFDDKGGYIKWDHSSDAAKQSQREKNGYLYLRKSTEKWKGYDDDSDEIKADPHLYKTEIIEAPDDTIRVPRVAPRYYNNKERDTTHPDFANWDVSGKQRYQVILQNGATVTYVWFKFIEQPAMKSAQQNHPETYTPEYLRTLQGYIEALHLAVNENSVESPTDPIFINYRGGDNPDDKDPHLAKIASTSLVRPEAGFEVGYVPIVISQYHPDDVAADKFGNINDSAQGLFNEPSQECSNDQWVDSFWHDI